MQFVAKRSVGAKAYELPICPTPLVADSPASASDSAPTGDASIKSSAARSNSSSGTSSAFSSSALQPSPLVDDSPPLGSPSSFSSTSSSSAFTRAMPPIGFNATPSSAAATPRLTYPPALAASTSLDAVFKAPAPPAWFRGGGPGAGTPGLPRGFPPGASAGATPLVLGARKRKNRPDHSVWELDMESQDAGIGTSSSESLLGMMSGFNGGGASAGGGQHTPLPAGLRTPHLGLRTPGSAAGSRTPSTFSGRSSSAPFGAHPAASGTGSVAWSSLRDARVVLALVEFRNRQSVGLAALDLNNPRLYLSQFSDNHMYTNALMLLHHLDPVEVLMSETAAESTLFRLVRAEHQLAALQQIKRKYFNESAGLELIERFCLPDSVITCNLDSTQYLCLAAAACLLKYVEFSQQIAWAPHSLKITMCNLNGFMQLDMPTIQALELVQPSTAAYATAATAASASGGGGGGAVAAGGGGGAGGLGGKKGRGRSLFEIVNHTRTRCGARMLRLSLLQPLNDIPTITLRQDCIEELLSSERLFFQFVGILPHFDSIDTLCSHLVQVPRKIQLSTTQQHVLHVVALQHMLAQLPQLHAVCASSSNVLFQTLANTLRSPSAEVIAQGIAQVINEDMAMNKKNAEQLRTQIVYAVRSGCSSMLDVARETYSEALEELHREVQRLLDEHKLTGGKLTYNTSRGYHLSVPSTLLPPDHLPEVFMQRVYRGNRVLCTTNLLLSLDNRQQEAFQDTCFFTSKAIADLLGEIRMHMPWLYNLSEAIALLDMLVSFATHISLNTGYVRPEFTTNGPVAIKQGRHPLLDKTKGNEYVANDCFLTELSHVLIVTGPNNAGKSTYLRQVATLAVLAHTGCFIPAEFASFRVLDQIFMSAASMVSSRMGVDVDKQSSTFFAEMREVSRVLHAAKPNALVLLDEVGRSTCNVDGVALAWSICESLRSLQCLALFATHYLELIELATLYPSIRNVSLKVSLEQQQAQDELAGSAAPGSSLAFARSSCSPFSSLSSSSSSSSSSQAGGATERDAQALTLPSFRYSFTVTNGATSERNRSYGLVVAEAAGFPVSILQTAQSVASQLRAGKQLTEPDENARNNIALHTLLGRVLTLRHTSLSAEQARAFLASASLAFSAELAAVAASANEERAVAGATG